MSIPPLTTVICLNVPDGWLFGVDLQFFQTTPQFRGVKAIPNGVHVVHWGVDQQNVRSGHFFVAEDQNVVILRWNKEKEEMEIGDEIGELDISAIKSRLGEYYNNFMVKYPESDNWNDLSNCIKGSNLSNSLAATVTSTSTTREENEILKKSLYESASSRAEKAGTTVEDDKIVQSLVDQPDALVFQDIDLKHSYKEGQIGCERTKNLLDKSWYLNNIVLKTISFDYLLGELQLGFLLMLLLANFSSAQQWLKIVDLLTRCESDLQHNPTRYSRFVKIISSQLNNCPQEYIESFLEPPRLEKAFSNFYADSPCLTNMNQLKSTLQRIGIQLSESEEDPEDQPVIVDMS